MYDYEYQDYVHIYNVCVSALVGMLLLIIIATLPGAVGAGPIYTSMLGFITWLPPPSHCIQLVPDKWGRATNQPPCTLLYMRAPVTSTEGTDRGHVLSACLKKKLGCFSTPEA